MNTPKTPDDELEIILTTFNNRIRREPRLKDPDAIVRDFIENHAETLAKLKAREARIRIEAQVEQLRSIRGSDVALNHGTIELLAYMSKGLNKEKQQLKNNPMPEGDLPTYNQKQVEANESIGWFIEDGLIKQVMTITPRKIDVIGGLDDNPMPEEMREHNEYDSLFTSALMKYHHHDWTMEMIREAALICSNTLPPSIKGNQ